MTRIVLTLLLFIVAVTVLMGIGALVIVLTPALNDHAMQYFPPMVAVSAAISLIASFLVAPRLRALHESA